MKKKNTIIYFLAILLLIACEYLLLSEIAVSQRGLVIVMSAAGVLTALAAIVFCVRRSSRDIL